ncbi:cytochrome P450 [Crepidotus variabilis]|uniref:Cytochrome P450 n=1 Tax=Crepidotus variabilis TaxID=179855 RepID=A0A9P6E9Q9_9AGAR|nr:cytochrome P450 [Crepidotus variabilis]
MKMILHLEVQRKGQAEIDAVKGFGRLPSNSDKPNFPYVRAFIAESLRFMPPIPLCQLISQNFQGDPHALKGDDVYGNYFLPKGAWIITSDRDTLLGPDPMAFNPDRYKGNDEAMEQVLSLVFGFGRRQCPGRLFAKNSLFALLAAPLAICDISPGLDISGRVELPKRLCTSGSVITPGPVRISVKSRSVAAEALLAEIEEVIG